MFPGFPARISDMRNRFSTLLSLVSLALCLRKTRVEKSHDYYDVIVSKSLVLKLFSANIETQSRRAFSNSLGLKSVFGKVRYFRDGLVWTVGLTVEIKPSCVFKFPRRGATSFSFCFLATNMKSFVFLATNRARRQITYPLDQLGRNAPSERILANKVT